MARKLPRWCKEARIAMIEKDLDVSTLAKEVGMTRQYVSSLLTGRHISDTGIKKISDYLGIKDSYDEP